MSWSCMLWRCSSKDGHGRANDMGSASFTFWTAWCGPPSGRSVDHQQVELCGQTLLSLSQLQIPRQACGLNSLMFHIRRKNPCPMRGNLLSAINQAFSPRIQAFVAQGQSTLPQLAAVLCSPFERCLPHGIVEGLMGVAFHRGLDTWLCCWPWGSTAFYVPARCWQSPTNM